MDSGLRGADVSGVLPAIDTSFARDWRAEILGARPLILPTRHFVYPAQAEEVERGALEVLVRPGQARPGLPTGLGTGPKHKTAERQFLATCALGFADPAAPSGVWSCPNPEELCAVSGGYAYVIDTARPERFSFLSFRPVLAVLPAVEAGLLVFAGHRALLAWGREGLAWETEKLSDEGVTITGMEGGILRGMGWEMMRDREAEFAVDLRTGLRLA